MCLFTIFSDLSNLWYSVTSQDKAKIISCSIQLHWPQYKRHSSSKENVLELQSFVKCSYTGVYNVISCDVLKNSSMHHSYASALRQCLKNVVLSIHCFYMGHKNNVDFSTSCLSGGCLIRDTQERTIKAISLWLWHCYHYGLLAQKRRFRSYKNDISSKSRGDACLAMDMFILRHVLYFWKISEIYCKCLQQVKCYGGTLHH